MIKKLFCLFIAASTLVACGGDEPVDPNTGGSGTEKPTPTPDPDPKPDPSSGLYQQVTSKSLPKADEKGNIIPDFSRVGYKWGDEVIPTLPVVKTLNPLANNADDATKMIQDAIDEVSKLPMTQRGAILLTKGLYTIKSTLRLKNSGIVLRGEGSGSGYGDNTVLYYTATTQSDLFKFGTENSVTFARPTTSNVKDSYVPVGRFWMRVNNASSFKVKDKVAVLFDPNQKWITDLRMDQIPDRTDGDPVTQWTPDGYKLTAERVVTKVSGDTLWFENPTVMTLEAQYGIVSVVKTTNVSTGRMSGSGIENMFLRSAYKGSEDEKHGWNAIQVLAAEHCWIKNVKGQYFGYSLVQLSSKSKNVTVTDCSHTDAVSIVTGGRRYTFVNSGQQNLVINCSAKDGRHSYNGSPRNAGPNVYAHCTGTNNRSDDGPHHRWNQGTLYDNINSDGAINIQDRGNFGSGHGWAGVTNVMWNCKYDAISVQSPWVCGKNYCIGSVGNKSKGRHPDRPDGVWISHGFAASPQSLYDAQLELRKKLQPGGVFDVN